MVEEYRTNTEIHNTLIHALNECDSSVMSDKCRYEHLKKAVNSVKLDLIYNSQQDYVNKKFSNSVVEDRIDNDDDDKLKKELRELKLELSVLKNRVECNEKLLADIMDLNKTIMPKINDIEHKIEGVSSYFTTY